MNTKKEQALTKMLDEMLEGKGGSVEEKLHNWLCDQEDDELFAGIMKKGKSIAGAAAYCKSQAQKEATNGMAMVDDDVVYGWARDYFVKVVEPKPKAKQKPKPKAKTKEKELSLDDLL